MSSGICFNLDQSKILSSGNGLRRILPNTVVRDCIRNPMELHVHEGKQSVFWTTNGINGSMANPR